MSQTSLKPFSDLKNWKNTLVLDWFGGISPNPVEYDNPLIDCFFTPLYKNKSAQYSRLLERQLRIGIPVGYLPNLYIGQHYKDGVEIADDPNKTEETIIIQINTKSTNDVINSTLNDLKFGHHYKLVAYNYFVMAKNSNLKILHGKLIQSNSRDTSLTVLIHDIELIRYYFTNSVYSCKNIFSNAFENDHIYKKVINSNYEGPFVNILTKESRFIYRHKYHKSDAITLGRILFEPDQHALRSAQHIHKSISKDRINHISGNLGYPRTFFPFKDKTVLTLKGRYIDIGAERIFITHEFLDCTAQFPFERLSYCSEISPENTSPDSDKPFYQHQSDEAQDNPIQDKGFSLSNQQPSKNAKTRVTVRTPRRFSGLLSVETTYEKRQPSTHYFAGIVANNKDDLEDNSTGAPTSGKSTAGPQDIDTEIVSPSEITSDLIIFHEAIGLFREMKPTRTIKPASQDNAMANDGYIFFPEVKCEYRKKQYRTFAYMDERKKFLRRIICMEIKIKKKYFYLFEAQRRHKNFIFDENSKYKESLPILLIWNNDYSTCTPSSFTPFLIATVKKGTWPYSMKHYHYYRDHTTHRKGDSPKDLAKRLNDLLIRNIPI